MRRTILFALWASVSIAGLTTVLVAEQVDPLKKLREKAEQLKKKIDCAVQPQDPACAQATPQGPQAPGSPAAGIPSAKRLDADFRSVPLAPIPAMPTTILEPVLSDDGRRAAGVAMKGSRFVVVVDGQEGPPFDEIKASLFTGERIPRGVATFGPGGTRVAYIGIRRGTAIAVVDGKEGDPFTSIVSRIDQDNPLSGHTFQFSNDGSRVAYVGSTDHPGSRTGPSLQVVLDGTARAAYSAIPEMMFAGNRHAYVGMKAARKYVLVLDGKEQSGTFDGIQHLRGNDAGHIAFVGRRGDTWTVVVNGVAGITHQQPSQNLNNLVLAPTKARVAYPVVDSQKRGVGGLAVDLYVDGRVVRSSIGFNRVVFSPDGDRLAAAYVTAEPGRAQVHRVMVDDWTSQDYADVPLAAAPSAGLQFSPDSKRFAFPARNGTSSFVVVDGEESSGYGTVRNFHFSSDSKRYGFEAYAGHGQGWVAVVDGKPGPNLYDLAEGSLTFSPDGSRVAYAGAARIGASTAVIDGQEQQVPIGTFQPRLVRNPLAWRGRGKQHLVFSRDGKHLAYVNGHYGSGKGVVMVDGRPQVPGSLFTQPTFSSDGQRFAHAVWVDQKWLLVVDGRSAPIDGDLYEVPGALAFEADGSLRYLVVKDNMLHRIVVTTKNSTY
jgi:Tol biopolymer transport system component